MKQFTFFCIILFTFISFDESKFYANAKSLKKIISWYSQIHSKDNPPQIFVQDEEEEQEEGMSTTMDSEIVNNSTDIIVNSKDFKNENPVKIKKTLKNKNEKFKIENTANHKNKIAKEETIDKNRAARNNRNGKNVKMYNETDKNDEKMTVGNSLKSTHNNSELHNRNLEYRSISGPIISPLRKFQNFISLLNREDERKTNIKNIETKESNFENNGDHENIDVKKIPEKSNLTIDYKISPSQNDLPTKISISYKAGNSETMPIQVQFSSSEKKNKNLVIDNSRYKTLIEKILPIIVSKFDQNIIGDRKVSLKRMKRNNASNENLDLSKIIRNITDNIVSQYNLINSAGEKKYYFLNGTDQEKENLIQNITDALSILVKVYNNITAYKNNSKLQPNKLIKIPLEKYKSKCEKEKINLPDVDNQIKNFHNKENIMENEENNEYEIGLLKSGKLPSDKQDILPTKKLTLSKLHSHNNNNSNMRKQNTKRGNEYIMYERIHLKQKDYSKDNQKEKCNHERFYIDDDSSNQVRNIFDSLIKSEKESNSYDSFGNNNKPLELLKTDKINKNEYTNSNENKELINKPLTKNLENKFIKDNNTQV